MWLGGWWDLNPGSSCSATISEPQKNYSQCFVEMVPGFVNASPLVALKSVKQATKSKTNAPGSNPVRPLSLLASISGWLRIFYWFDRFYSRSWRCTAHWNRLTGARFKPETNESSLQMYCSELFHTVATVVQLLCWRNHPASTNRLKFYWILIVWQAQFRLFVSFQSSQLSYFDKDSKFRIHCQIRLWCFC